MERQYVAIDLKSFYASVECVDRGLDPLDTNLVVADSSRTEKTICLAVTPSLKAYGIPGRARLFEVVQAVRNINAQRLKKAPRDRFSGSSFSARELAGNPSLELSYIVAGPRMAYYMEYSTRIYQIYLRYVAPEDIHVYSVDEVFIDVTGYLPTYGMTAHELTVKIVRDILAETGITATAGIGTNLYLCKVAMDIVAKHMPADSDGVRIAELDEMSYRKLLWAHRPITDFWRVGRGYARRLESIGVYTMGDVARYSIESEEILYRLFGVNAELLIDHAWGWESCTMQAIKSYRPRTSSISSGQVLQGPCDSDTTRLIVWEMADSLSLDLVAKGLVTNQIVLTVGYDIDNLRDPEISEMYKGEVTTDRYGRRVPKHSHGTARLGLHTSSSKKLTEASMELFDRIIDENLLTRRINLTAANVISESEAETSDDSFQLSFFMDSDEEIKRRKVESESLERERSLQRAMLDIKQKFGKNAILKGVSYKDGATARERNSKIGGHNA